ncbi:MAG: hypothetical protein HZB13_14255 [Acidobacteria bacterium]|nr:hypothetical protein [Acidobacteriota bacterium]
MFCLKTATLIIAAGLVSTIAPPAYGQKWEVGAGGGASIYKSSQITGRTATVDAKFKPGYGFTGYVGQLGNRVGGEIRYSFFSNEMELSGGGKNFTMGGRSQAIHYDVLLYFNKRESKTRPYLLAGGGVKQYTGTGNAVPLQPFISTAVLTNTSEWKPMITAGAGVRFAMGAKTHLRIEVLSYMTQAPKNVITPVNGAALDGWFLSFAPVFSVSYVW